MNEPGVHMKELTTHLMTLLQKRELKAFRLLIDELQPYDLSQVFFQLNGIHRRHFLIGLKPQEIANLIEELDINEQKEVIIALGPAKSAQVLNLMSADDVADLLTELDLSKAQTLLKDMEQVEADKVRALLLYEEDTAGGLMTNEFVSVYSHLTVEEAIQFLRQAAPTAETIYYLYVIDTEKRLVGVVSLRELLIAHPQTPVSEIMYERVISVTANTDQEEVARLLEKYDFLAIPVVDEEKHLLGIVTVDDIIDVLIEEAQEDISNLSAVGITDKEVLVNPFLSARRRIPWLILLLLIGMITANLIGLFEHTIEILPVLTVFMPMIAGMTGNTATQSFALIIRGLSNNQLNRENYNKVVWQESLVGIIIGLICSGLITVMISIWKNSWGLGLIVGGSLFFTLVIGTLVGTLIPILLDAMKIDPTVASGPLITTLNDVFSLMIYFGLATFFIHQLL